MTVGTDVVDVNRETLEPLPQFSLKQVLAITMAFTVLGFGIGFLVAARKPIVGPRQGALCGAELRRIARATD